MQSSEKKTPVAPVPAATILLVRDAPDGLEVFMVKRHHQIDFVSGALVFPGGKVHHDDNETGLSDFADGGADWSADKRALGAAAIREAFEESGILLARDAKTGDFVDATKLEALEPYRARLDKHEIPLLELLREEGLRLALDQLVPFAHWITPAVRPRRYDTYFYLAPAPPVQEARHDGHEAVDSIWIAPSQAAADGAAHRVKMIFATRFNLQKLARSTSSAAAFAAACADKIVTVVPEYRETPQGLMWCIPIEAGYGIAETPVQGEPIA